MRHFPQEYIDRIKAARQIRTAAAAADLSGTDLAQLCELSNTMVYHAMAPYTKTGTLKRNLPGIRSLEKIYKILDLGPVPVLDRYANAFGQNHNVVPTDAPSPEEVADVADDAPEPAVPVAPESDEEIIDQWYELLLEGYRIIMFDGDRPTSAQLEWAERVFNAIVSK